MMDHGIISELNEIACEWSYEKYAKRETGYTREYWQSYKLAELIIAECRNVVNEVYHKTPLELCGPLLTADEEIAKHFYGVEE
jgi:hypothetical protein